MIRLIATMLVMLPAIARADLDEDRDDLREAVAIVKGIKPSTPSINALMELGEAQGRYGDREEARKSFAIVRNVLKKLERSYLRRELLASLAQAQANAGLDDDARDTIELFLKAAKLPNKSTPPGQEAAAILYRTPDIAAALITLGDYPKAREAARAEYPDADAMPENQKAAAKKWLDRTLDRIDLKEAEALLLKGDPEAKQRAVATFMDKAKATGKPAEADTIYSALSVARAKAGDIAGAKASVELIGVENTTVYARAETLRMIARIQFDSGDRAGAIETARAALKVQQATRPPATPSRYDGFRDERKLASALGVIAEVEGPDAAVKLIDELDGPKARLLACLSIAKVRAEQKDRDGAKVLCDRAEKLAQGLDEAKLKTEGMDEVLSHRITLGLTDDPESMLKGLSNDRFGMTQISAMAALLAKGDIDGAMRMERAIDPKSFLAGGGGLAVMSQLASKKGHTKEVVRLARMAKDDRNQCIILGGMAVGVIARVKEQGRLAEKPRM